jgi:MYXO-CTERM domain-containing protein
MMKGILTEDGLKPKILEEAVEGEKATVQVDIDGTKRSIELVMVDDTWLIDVNQGVNPNLIIPPEELDEAVADEFEVGEPENEMWWEEREAAKAKEAEKKKGCLGCSISSGPAWSDAALWGGLLLLLGSLSWRQRTHERLSKGYATKRANARCQLPVEANHMSAHRASTKAARCGPRGVQS